ncbi:MAG: 50S ribosomal protein L3 [Bdellovibrionales bacterium]|nr:50S ribosomal protein L3 [Bdellovibrionales bacterium]
MNALFGRKLGMTRVYDDAGRSVPVTVVELGPNTVHQVKTEEKDGYRAVQLGFGEQKPQRVNRALTGHFSKAKAGFPKFVGEVRLDEIGMEDDGEYEVGQQIAVADVFEPGKKVDVRGVTVGKGFAGVMKRHGMRGQPSTHGTHEYFRHGGSIGNRKFPGRVFKNKRMPGHMGSTVVLQEGLEVFAIRPEDNAILIKGSVPGPKNGYVFVRKSLKH